MAKKGAGGLTTRAGAVRVDNSLSGAPAASSVPPAAGPGSPALRCPRGQWAPGSLASGPQLPERPHCWPSEKPTALWSGDPAAAPGGGAQPYQVVAGRLERVGPTHVQGAGAERLQHSDVVEAFRLQGDTRTRQSPAGPTASRTSGHRWPRPAPRLGPISHAHSALPRRWGRSQTWPPGQTRLRCPQAGHQGPGPFTPSLTHPLPRRPPPERPTYSRSTPGTCLVPPERWVRSILPAIPVPGDPSPLPQCAGPETECLWGQAG